MEKHTIFQDCTSAVLLDDKFDILQCISDKLEKLNTEDSISRMNTKGYLLVLSGALVFFMQTGFAMLCAGAVRKKNVQNTMLKNLLDACGTAVAFFCVGYAFAFGGENGDETKTTFIGTENFFNTGDVDLGFWFFQYTISTASVTIIAGTLAERCQMTGYLLYSLFLSGFVYPVIAHAIWSKNGFLSPNNVDPFLGIGMVDFAGCGVVHLTGGSIALYAAIILGPRRGRFHDARTGLLLEEPKVFKGHSVALQVLGTFCLWFGWLGFNAGSALLIKDEKYTTELAVHAAVNTSIAAATAGMVALFVNLILEERNTGDYNFSLSHAMNGCLSGLVAITAGCGTMENWAAFITGVVSGFLYLASSNLLVRHKIDDCVDAIPVHMFNSCWGVIATGLFSTPELLFMAYGINEHPGWFYSLSRGSSDAHLLACQLIGIVFILSWTIMLMVPFFLWLNYMGWFRCVIVTEMVGLDMLYHGEAGNCEEEEDDKVKEEYMDKFSMYKASVLKRQNVRGGRTTGTGSSKDGESESRNSTSTGRQSNPSKSSRLTQAHVEALSKAHLEDV